MNPGSRKDRMARLSEQEWRMLRGIRAREALTRQVLLREAEARSLRDLTVQKLRLKEAEVAAIRSELARIDEMISAKVTQQVAEESLVPQI